MVAYIGEHCEVDSPFDVVVSAPVPWDNPAEAAEIAAGFADAGRHGGWICSRRTAQGSRGPCSVSGAARRADRERRGSSPSHHAGPRAPKMLPKEENMASLTESLSYALPITPMSGTHAFQ